MKHLFLCASGCTECGICCMSEHLGKVLLNASWQMRFKVICCVQFLHRAWLPPSSKQSTICVTAAAASTDAVVVHKFLRMGLGYWF